MNDVWVCHKKIGTSLGNIIWYLTAIRPNCTNDPRAVSALLITVDVSTTMGGRAWVPSSDSDIAGQVGMAEVVSCVNNTDFHLSFGGDWPEWGNVHHVDSKGCLLCSLEKTTLSLRIFVRHQVGLNRVADNCSQKRERERERELVFCVREREMLASGKC